MQIHIYLLKRDNNVTFLIKIVFSYKKISNKKLFIILLLLPWQMLNLALYINHFHEKKSELYLYRVLRSFTVFNTYMYLLTQAYRVASAHCSKKYGKSRLLLHHNNVRTTTVVVVVVHTPHSFPKNDRTRTVSAHLNVLFK